ncbi:non-hydrolyzing UDP-N-acetylglucosamine 2-epimerase [Parablastomonas sp. CN1-191]|uniref:non-hydrolyzing UDP-N-acetylglucosamine 2-epimerase n=1 Tax=Parablastomonas sp. CN1-191 TaxID=3400908 RepID=UPI003BF85AB1
MRLLVVLGTRPEAIKLMPVVTALRADPAVHVEVCATGQHRGLLDQVLAPAGLVPDHDLDLMRPGQSLDSLLAAATEGIGRVLDAARPDRVIVQGDTASALAGALAAFHRQVPVAHVEAGLRSGDPAQPFPEEAYRRTITLLADLHFAPTQGAVDALLAERVDAASVHLTGNTGIDALFALRGSSPGSVVAAVLGNLGARRLLLVTCHRRENIGPPLDAVIEALAALAARGDVAVALPLHPNPAVASRIRARLGALGGVILLPALSYPDFAALMAAASVILTDSGGVQEEAPALGKPVLVLRETTERPEGVAAGTARLVGTDSARIVAETARLLDDPAAHAAMALAHSPYGDGRAARRIAAILAAGAPR